MGAREWGEWGSIGVGRSGGEGLRWTAQPQLCRDHSRLRDINFKGFKHGQLDMGVCS